MDIECKKFAKEIRLLDKEMRRLVKVYIGIKFNKIVFLTDLS